MRLHALALLIAVPALTLSACTGDIKDGKPVDTDTGSILDTADTSAVVETACDDGADDDGDGATDCDDADCASDAACLPTGECWDQDLGSATGNALATGTLEGAVDDARSACGTDESVDVLFKWKAPAAGLWRFSAAGSDIDTVIAILNPDCSGQERLCVEGAVLERRLPADEEVLVMLEGVEGAVGTYTLGIVASSTTESDCGNAADDDLDGLTDCDDSDCETAPQCLGEDDCTNGIDDDLDGAADCDDSECASDTNCLVEDCDNHRDDDRDGLVDCNDDACAMLPVCIPEVDCTNGLDDEGDGVADCDDSDCLAEASCIGACTDADLGSAVGIAVATGDTTGMGDDRTPSTCGSSSAEDAAYSWTAPATGSWTFSTDGSDFDTVLTVEEGGCSGATEVACDDDGGTAPDSLVSVSLTAGDTVIVNVDGFSSGAGTYALNILAGFEMDCADGVDEDGDGASDCDDTDCDLSCPEDLCMDGLDEDADGATDCDDSDCVGTAACLYESDCTDGLDDDTDGYTDCDDPSCATDAACRAVDCLTDDLGSALGENIVTLDTSGAGDDTTPSCSVYASEDAQVQWTAPADGTYTFTAAWGTGYYPLIDVSTGDCSGGTSLDCQYDYGGSGAIATATVRAGDVLIVTVEALYGDTGTFPLSITTASELLCDDGMDDDADGAIDCDDSECTASCYEVTCDDGVDGDADGLTDCDDSDCATDAHCIPEPDCNDGTDEDTDALVDCDDSDCVADFACTGDCFDATLLAGLGADLATGTSAGDDHTGACASGTGGADTTWLWTAPADDYFTFSTDGSDYHTVVSVDTAACSGATELGCDDDGGGVGASSVRVALTTGEQVLVTLDAASDADMGTYALGIFGDAEHACADGTDDDRDGSVDCDDSDCLGTPACAEPDCSDGTDDDGDGPADCLDSDCDADAACSSALTDFDLGSATGTGVATGSNTSATATLAASCVSTGGQDVIYRWVAPSTGTWTFDLTGSSYDTSLTINDLGGGELTCDDDSGSGTTSMLTWPVHEGEAVLVVIGGFSSFSTGSYTLAIY